MRRCLCTSFINNSKPVEAVVVTPENMLVQPRLAQHRVRAHGAGAGWAGRAECTQRHSAIVLQLFEGCRWTKERGSSRTGSQPEYDDGLQGKAPSSCRVGLKLKAGQTLSPWELVLLQRPSVTCGKTMCPLTPGLICSFPSHLFSLQVCLPGAGMAAGCQLG